jgi:DNA/RNA-binding domain of Phe-tRNA-synthetase-like protein
MKNKMANDQDTLFVPSPAWREAYPHASAGILAIRDANNPAQHPALEARKAALAAELREAYAGLERTSLRALPTIQAYADYYKRFKKTYHIQLQLESVVLKGKPLPQVSSLVDAMFMAELTTLLLTAGHDLAKVQLPVRLDIAAGHEKYTRLQGIEETLKPGDMYMADQEGVISSVIYGPDRRTRIQTDTDQVLYTVYAPAKIEPAAVKEHLRTLYGLVQLISPECVLVEEEVYPP